MGSGATPGASASATPAAPAAGAAATTRPEVIITKKSTTELLPVPVQDSLVMSLLATPN